MVSKESCLKKEPLPKLQEGFWGTRKLIKVLGGKQVQQVAQIDEEDAVASKVEQGDDEIKQVDDVGSFWELQPLCANKKVHWYLTVLYVIASFGLYIGVLYLNHNADTELGEPEYFSCGRTKWSTRGCGVLGQDCAPFNSTEWVPARCGRFCSNQDVYGSGPYVAGSSICASAIHAGVISDFRGGCFAYRYTGEQLSFEGSEKNGVKSSDYGWFPKGIEFRAIEGERCNTVLPSLTFLTFALIIILILVVRPSDLVLFLYTITIGFLFLVDYRSDYWGDELYVDALNYQSAKWFFVLIPISLLLYDFSVKGTMPSGNRFPLDFVLFYFLPYWFGIRMDELVELGFDITLTESAFSQPKYIIGFCILVGVGLPLVVAQMVLHYKADTWKPIVKFAAVFFTVVIIISIASKDYLTFHLHHFFLGLMFVNFFRGQPKWRFSIIFQAALLGSFVNGVVVWSAGEFFDPVEPTYPVTTTPVLYYSAVNMSDFINGEQNITLQWEPEETVFDVYNCSRDLLNSTYPETNNLRRRLDVLPDLLVVPSVTISTNGVYFLDEKTLDTSFEVNRLPSDTEFIFNIRSDEYRSPDLQIITNQTFFYDPLNATFANDPCQRIYAIYNQIQLQDDDVEA